MLTEKLLGFFGEGLTDGVGGVTAGLRVVFEFGSLFASQLSRHLYLHADEQVSLAAAS